MRSWMIIVAAAAALFLPADYPDGRPTAILRLEARDQGVVLKHGEGPGECDKLGARDIWVFEADGTYYMHYDGAGPRGWLACLATSADLVHWIKKGPVLDFGKPGKNCIGLPGVVKVKDRLAILYDAPGGGSKSHMGRAIGLAWLRLPLRAPADKKERSS